MSSNKILVESVRELTKGQEKSERENERKGVTVSDIERWLVSQKYYLTKDEFKCPLHVSLQKEVSAGRLEKLQNGTYVLSAQQISKDKVTEMKQKALIKKVAIGPGKRGRPTKKRFDKKKAKRSHSHYEEEECPVDPPQPTDLSEETCDYCLQSAETNKKGLPEQLLICKDCNAKAHPSCMTYSEILSARARLYPWQCIDCKTCCICLDACDPDNLMFCDACDKGYHMNCHDPKVTEKPTGKWVCSECSEQGISEKDLEETTDNKQTDTLTGNTSCDYPTPCESPLTEYNTGARSFCKLSAIRNEVSSLPRIDHGKYPDASKWTTNDVVQFFNSIGFTDQAEAFREQEIDGQSLLLMKRSDVLTGLDIRLGPALKMYQHVLKLQAVGLENSLF